LRASGGNRAKAAERLGIGVATLYRKLKQEGDPSTGASERLRS
jgi:DNA-binding NtrC family response regulator